MKTFTCFKTSLGIAVLAVFGFIPQQGRAQITITESDLTQIGSDYVAANDTLPTVTPGSRGTNQTWNLSGIKNLYQDTAFVVNAYTLPYYADFATANIGERIDLKGIREYAFGNISSSQLATV